MTYHHRGTLAGAVQNPRHIARTVQACCRRTHNRPTSLQVASTQVHSKQSVANDRRWLGVGACISEHQIRIPAGLACPFAKVPGTTSSPRWSENLIFTSDEGYNPVPVACRRSPPATLTRGTALPNADKATPDKENPSCRMTVSLAAKSLSVTIEYSPLGNPTPLMRATTPALVRLATQTDAGMERSRMRRTEEDELGRSWLMKVKAAAGAEDGPAR